MVHAISADFIRRLKISDSAYTDVLFSYANTANEHKIIIDKKQKVFDVYKENCRNIEIKTWVEFMFCYRRAKVEFVDVELDESLNDDEKFLKLCQYARGKKSLIVYSIQSSPYDIDDNNEIEFEGSKIPVMDKDSARQDLNSNICAINSIVAINNSQISNVNNQNDNYV